MSTKLTINPTKRGTYIVRCDFEDEDGEAITPKTANWTLTDPGGNVINLRNNVAFLPLATSVIAVLSGADTTLQGINDSGQRVFTVEATYDSDVGLNLPINEQAYFEIERLVAIED